MVRAGSTDRFGLLVERHQAQAMTLAVRMLRDRQDAEEAVQDAFVRAYRALSGFQGGARFSTWLYRIVYNVCLNRLAKVDRGAFQEPYDDERTSPGEWTDPFEADDLVAYVRRSIASLPPKYATILSLFYLQDLSHEEICEVTALPLGTVKTHLFRARALLQRTLAKELHMEQTA